MIFRFRSGRVAGPEAVDETHAAARAARARDRALVGGVGVEGGQERVHVDADRVGAARGHEAKLADRPVAEVEHALALERGQPVTAEQLERACERERRAVLGRVVPFRRELDALETFALGRGERSGRGVREVRARVGVAVNVFLTFLKIGVGALTGSLALVADGVHSLFDTVTDLVVIVATRLGSRPPDEEHPWGHGKIETLGALIISIIFTVAGFEISKEAATSLWQGEVRFPGA